MWRVLFSGIYCCVDLWNSASVSEEHNHHQVQSVSQSRNQLEVGNLCVLVAGFWTGLLLYPNDGRDMFSKISHNFHWTTHYYMPENKTLHSHHCVNLKSNTEINVLSVQLEVWNGSRSSWYNILKWDMLKHFLRHELVSFVKSILI